MATYRAQIGFAFDTALPRDVITINPHYNGDNALALANALKANLIANTNVAQAVPFRIKIYDAKQPPPSYPLADVSNGTGFATSIMPREVSLCLSFYATWNRPSYRGRLFLPAMLIGGGLALRPTAGQMASALAWRSTFANGLPSGTIWSVYSRKLGITSGINTAWCDDEWDTQRSRGLRPTERVTAAVP